MGMPVPTGVSGGRRGNAGATPGTQTTQGTRRALGEGAAVTQGTETHRVRAREFGDQLLQRLLHHVMDSVPGTVGAGLSLVGGAGPRHVYGVAVAAELDAMQWATGEGPLVDAVARQAAEHHAVLILPGPDGEFDLHRWPALAGAWEQTGATWPTGLAVATGQWGEQSPTVFSLYTDIVPDTSLAAELDRFEGLLVSALAVVEYCAGEELRAEQMLQMVQYRRVIEQAKGLVMAATGADAGAAFTTLARASQHFNIRLRNLAIALVEHVGGSPAEGPEDPAQVVVPTVTDRRTAAQVWAALTRTLPQERPPSSGSA